MKTTNRKVKYRSIFQTHSAHNHLFPLQMICGFTTSIVWSRFILFQSNHRKLSSVLLHLWTSWPWMLLYACFVDLIRIVLDRKVIPLLIDVFVGFFGWILFFDGLRRLFWCRLLFLLVSCALLFVRDKPVDSGSRWSTDGELFMSDKTSFELTLWARRRDEGAIVTKTVIHLHISRSSVEWL